MADANSCRPLPQITPQKNFSLIADRLSVPVNYPLRPPRDDRIAPARAAGFRVVVGLVGHQLP